MSFEFACLGLDHVNKLLSKAKNFQFLRSRPHYAVFSLLFSNEIVKLNLDS